ncbi:hypothetical protein CERZMDRAFT_106105 [Cercospora zeae-maydis SCOH1-5]|uniref:Protein kinase domain-containing protein n=1 Tax=Cercospora zeae-maydis SCOH1-5 TaxID=717836 RepID=A0A6A6FFL2_9PEZI|nr:hypothetical protein CERZMDRAFT_106105 [Cercospora zeae-maydis SCOH1-5]
MALPKMWTIHSIGLNDKKDTVFALVFSGQHKVIAGVKRVGREPHNFEDAILSMYDDQPEGTSRDRKEHAEKTLLAAIADSEQMRDFTRAALRSSSVLWISTKDGGPRARLTEDTDAYSVFKSCLSPPHGIVAAKNGEKPITLPNKLVPYEQIQYDRPIDSWRMTSSKASISSQPEADFVYKGVTFYQFLVMGVDKFRAEMTPCYREIQMVNYHLKKHPGIIPPAEYLVYVLASEDSSVQLVVGSLYTWLEGGALGDFIDKSVRENRPISLARRAEWCHQLCSAVADLHYRSRAWHQDIKPGNILIDNTNQLKLCDWEQWGGAQFVRAPEVNQELDVQETGETVNGKMQLKYSRYEGAPRQNSAVDPYWNVYPVWIETCPLAAELGEVYSLGKTLWVLLEQVVREPDPMISDYTTIKVCWKSTDIPKSWTDIVDAAIAEDPNARPRLSELVSFWEQEKLGLPL